MTCNRAAARNPSSDVSTGPAEGEAQAEAAAARGEPQPAVHRAALKSNPPPRLGREFDATAEAHESGGQSTHSWTLHNHSRQWSGR